MGTHAMAHSQRAALWRRWTIATAAGEFIGFAIPAAVGVLAATLALPDQIRFVPLVLAGIGEGAVLGLAQWLAVRSTLRQLRGRAWIGATAGAAGFAWAVGLLPSTSTNLQALEGPLQILMFVTLGLVFLLTIGGAQWFVLRRHVDRAAWWILANALAWPVGVAIPVFGLSSLPQTASLATQLVVGIGCGLLMGLVVGALTGFVLITLLRTHGDTTAQPIDSYPASMRSTQERRHI